MRRAVVAVVGTAWVLAGCAAPTAETRAEAGAIVSPTPAPSGLPEGIGLDGTVDSDGDLLSDVQEADIGTDPHSRDTDGDGLSDLTELVNSLTDPTLASTDGVVPDGESDIDGDGIGFLREAELGTDALDPDTDFDGLDDGDELDRGTDPTRADTDGDGLSDGIEVESGLDPLVAQERGDLARSITEGDVTVIAEGPAEAISRVRIGRGGHYGWDDSAVILTESVSVLDLDGVDSLTFVVDVAGLDAAPEDVGILVEGFDTATFVALDCDYDAATGTVTATWEVAEGEGYPTVAVIDFPAWLAFFEDFDY